MRELTSDALVRLAVDALDRTAFLMAEGVDDDATSSLPPTAHYVRIDYHGPERGEVVVAASAGFLRALTAGLLGENPGKIDAARYGTDALRELANILAGSLINELGGQRCPFLLGLPSDCGPEALPTAPTEAAHLNVEGERLDMYWRRDAAIADAA